MQKLNNRQKEQNLSRVNKGGSSKRAGRERENRAHEAGESKEGSVPAKLEPYQADAKVKRNDPCPCGSGKKHKKCCLLK
jgi:uncharacterized protein YchJ